MITGLAAAPSAQAAPTHRHSVTWVRQWLAGKWTSGPNTWTHWQRIQITGTHYSRPKCGKPGYIVDDVMHQYPNPTAPTGSARSVHILASRTLQSSATPTICAGPTGGLVSYSWYNPASWNWGHILSVSWNALWNHCLKGSVTGLVGTASGTVIVNLLARGAKLVPGPYGYAAVAIGGCVSVMLFGS